MSVIKVIDLDLKGKRVFIRADLNVPGKGRQGYIRCAYYCFHGYHQLLPATGSQSDGDFAPGPPRRRRVV